MNIADLRREMDLTLGQFAQRLGLKSKSHAYAMERDGKCSVAMALRIEDLSDGRIPASSLNADVGLVERKRGVTADKRAA